MTDLLELAEQYERHGVRLADKANEHSRLVNMNLVATAAHCFTVAAALRARSEAAAVGGR